MSDTPEVPAESKDFKQFRRSGRRWGFSLWIGTGFCVARDAIARGLVAVGATPNVVTFAGFLATCGAGVCFAVGAGHVLPPGGAPAGATASWWPLYGAMLIFVAAAFDMLDGAVARVGNLSSPFGAVWDSTIDRCSDLAIFMGCAAYFTLAANLTGVLLSFSAAGAALLTSYVKARSENLIDKCDVGYWQRGERIAAVIIAACAGHLPAMLWLLATTPWLTVLRRVRHVHCRMSDSVTEWQPGRVLRWLMIWRHPRGSVGYDVATGLNILFLIVGPWIWPFFYATSDPLGDALRRALAS
jgi:CDP-diacylglycerol--glycerol-3-phosphate 3-phosphatidyltransferase